jgi:hypothetical protein
VTGPSVYVPNQSRNLAEACATDFGRLAFDGFGVMLSDEQLEAQQKFGTFGPRQRGEFKNNWLSGGQRGGKTVLAAMLHADGALYKRGVDNTDRLYWKNYAYGLLAIAPIDQLALRLYGIMADLSKGASDAQWDRGARRARGGAFLSRMRPGKIGPWGIVRFSNGSFVDFRSSEGRAYRLEGGQWWGCTWDEWASQPDYEIDDVRKDVLLGRLRDHDAKLLAMAWPKAETEHHLIEVIRAIGAGKDPDSQVVYISAADAYFTNQKALDVEKRSKDEARYMRTVLGRPAGGAAVEFKTWMVNNARRPIPRQELPIDDFAYFNSWDIGLAHDSTVGLTWRIPIVNGKRTVSPEYKARIVDFIELRGSDGLTIDTVTYRIAAQQALYHALTALDASSMGGTAASRQLKGLHPAPLSFVSRSNDRLHGNMRLAAITNALDLMTWGRVDQKELALHHGDAVWQPPELETPWGVVEYSDDLIEMTDQLLAFDRDAKHQKDDRAWAFMIGLWYIRQYWVQALGARPGPVPFDVRGGGGGTVVRGPRRARLVGLSGTASAVAPSGVRLIRPAGR